MKKCIFLLFFIPCVAFSQETTNPKTIHVYVALCDNINQGIVPVPKSLGNGQSPKSNLYWGALYGVKTHFKRSSDWDLVKTLVNPNSKILERVLFKHRTTNTYLLADAYDGEFIKQTTVRLSKGR